MKKYISAIAAIAISTQLVAVEKQNIPMAPTQPNQKTTIVSAKSIDLEQEVVRNEESSMASAQGNKLPLPKLTQKTKVKSYDAIIEMLKTRDSYKIEKNQDDAKIAEEEKKKEDRILEQKIEKKQKEIDSKVDREVQELLLPIPIGSITIGDKIIMYAEYREKRLKDNVLPGEMSKIATTTEAQGNSSAAVSKAASSTASATALGSNSLGSNSSGLPPLAFQTQGALNADTTGVGSNSTSVKSASKTVIELQDSVFESKRIRVKIGDAFKGGWIIKTLNENFIEYINPRFPNETVKKYN